ncbi:MAG: hypothetical protein ACFNTU_05475 [Catonella sp.]
MENRALKETIHCTGSQIAKLFGLTVRSIQNLSADGIIETEKAKGGKRYNLEDTVKRYIAHLSNKAHGRLESKNEEELRAQKLKAEIRLKESQGELHALKTDIVTGKYITVEEVKSDYERFFITFKNFVMGIPAKVTVEISGAIEPAEVRRIEKKLSEEMAEILREIVVNAEKENSKGKGNK